MPPKEAPLLQTLLRGMGNKSALLDIVQNFTVFDHSEGSAQAAKIVARNHQYLGVNRVIQRLVSDDPAIQAEVAAGRLGVYWHTQGSGKSYSMVFLVNKVRRTLGGRYSFLVVTDRLDLDEQIATTFAQCDVIADVKTARIPDSASVEERLKLDLRVQFALVQKFKRRPPKEGLTDKPDLIVLSGAINLVYQFWIHTEVVGKLGPVEWVFNTASHHRVHHGSNPQYLDKNYGGILIIWDRMFGTFEPEREPVIYGLTKNIHSYNLFTIAFHEWRALGRDLRATPRWSDRLGRLYHGPAWDPVAPASDPQYAPKQS